MHNAAMRSSQPALFEVPTVLTTTGIHYLMTDGYLLKNGWSGRATPKPRSGELRARIIGFQPGTRDDERAFRDVIRPWIVGGEWFRMPDSPKILDWLFLIAEDMGQWKGIPARTALLDVVANNLKVKSAA